MKADILSSQSAWSQSSTQFASRRVTTTLQDTLDFKVYGLCCYTWGEWSSPRLPLRRAVAEPVSLHFSSVLTPHIALSIYIELWATYSAYYIRRFGTQANRRQAFVAAVVPWLPIIIAVVPPAVFFSLAGKDFNKSFQQFLDTRETMRAHEKTWTIADALDLAQRKSSLF